uniref:semaphorin-4A-like n=1 Tax=Oncorhynchus gorbuscha TaxID=8017 RepID=UPI001EAF14FF|nr:semaphorin-4A-like [Oncorhynchus gorbuscha]
MAYGNLAWSLSALLGLLLTPSLGLEPPRISFPLESPERPLPLFSQPDIKNTTTLLLSDDGSTLFVGAQDAVLSLDVSQPDVITMKTKMEWKPPPDVLHECTTKGKKETTDCPNFVRVLQPINATHLYACGTFAYNPHDTYMDTDTLTMAKVPRKYNNGRGCCPFNPYQRNTAISVDGELFTATTNDFRGKTPMVSRHLSKDGRPDVSQDTSVTLNEPTFVSSASDTSEGKVYFFFSEVGNEYSFLDEFKVARVAQVCKDDSGGERILQNRWTSFAKAELLCRPPKELPFNIIQDVFTLTPSEGYSTQDIIFYGIFTSQWSVASGQSAVCAFRLGDIKYVFAGNYKIFQNHQWSPRMDKSSNLGKCGLANASDTTLMAVKESFLASGSVRPIGSAPVLNSPDQRYSRIAALRTKAANGQDYTILFLLSESGFLHKVVLLNKDTHIIEEIQVFRQPQLVKNILLSTSKGVLYVGTSEGVTQVPVSQCSSYKSCAQCVLARDPLCGWDPASGHCASVSAIPANARQDVEHGNVMKECQGSLTAKPLLVEVYAQLNEVVRLKCSRSSNLATLSWKSAKASALPHHLFFHSGDENLVFMATPDTFGIYHCISVERGYEETAAIYTVRQSVSPQAIDTPAIQIRITTTETKDQMTTMMETPSDTEKLGLINFGEDPVITTDVTTTNKTPDTQSTTENLEDKTPDTNSSTEKPEDMTPDPQSSSEKPEDIVNHNEPLIAKNYHSELVAVSFLLAVCVCVLVLVLGGLYGGHLQGRYKLGPSETAEGGYKEENDPLEVSPPSIKMAE